MEDRQFFTGIYNTKIRDDLSIQLTEGFQKKLAEVTEVKYIVGCGFISVCSCELVDEIIESMHEEEKFMDVSVKKGQCVNGKVILSQDLLKEARFTTDMDLYIVGAGDNFEIWECRKWDEEFNELEAEIAGLLDSLGEF
ncbi:hypothetical protein M2454_001374 [Aequitasia blattaphilus]|uniref:Transcriptional regulator MraZ n=1 Tax=Aequitasia blattaphilus TaxID=2949332 RepID=A0ABT1EAF0_9FIRM|nr:hypothetical protein [Aequitasia blattaphilus]MCP1101841.1 hypothetical protein [Aequitasia blattaphilus]MCR8614481.1 hypothetical protein [Aequitasia blattaphilus]